MSLAAAVPGCVRPPFDTVYQEQLQGVWRYVRRLGVADRDLEDVVHDTFVVAHRQYGVYDPTAPVRPWLLGIAFRVVSHHHRRTRVRKEQLAPADTHADPAGTPEAALQAKQASDRLQAALATLPLEQRAVFVLHDLEDHSMPDIQLILQVPVNTLYSRLRLARERLARTLRGWRSEGGRT